MDKKPLHIRLADEDEGDRLIFTEAFAELTITTSVHTVNNGLQLMERINTKGVCLTNFLFLDLNMPRKNGLECLKEIRNNTKFKEIFIAICSTSSNEKDIAETQRHGANGYITKPNNLIKVKQILEKTITTEQVQIKPGKSTILKVGI